MLENTIDKVRTGAIVTLTAEQLADLLAQAELIFEEDTYVSDMIRILKFEDLVLVQETTDGKQIIARSRPSVEEAREFVAGRMKTYERMWDTCGLRVSYFDE
jgi:hypothetical protein